jgi:hypothetical protein
MKFSSLKYRITFFKRGPADPSQQCKIASNNIQDPLPRWILTIFKLKFGGGNLFSPAMTSTIERNNSVGSLLEPLLKKVTRIVGSRMLCPSPPPSLYTWQWLTGPGRRVGADSAKAVKHIRLWSLELPIMFFMDEQLARKRLLSLVILSSWLGAGIQA